MRRAALLVTAFAVAGFGCATDGGFQSPNNAPLLIESNYQAAGHLMASAKPTLDKSAPIIVATFVSIDDLNRSSRLGRLFSEQVSAKITQLGYTVIELKLRGTLFIKHSEGELLLSREVREISSSHNAQAVIVGTYAEGSTHIWINVKAVGAKSNVIVAAHDYALPLTANLRTLLSGRN